MLVTCPYTGHFDEECHVFTSDFQRFMWFLMYNHLGCLTRMNEGGLLDGPLGFGKMPKYKRYCTEELMETILFVKQSSLQKIRDAHTDKLGHELRELLSSSESSSDEDDEESSDTSDDDESIIASWTRTTVVEAADDVHHQEVIRIDDDEDDDVSVQTVIEIDADVANDASGSEQQQQAPDDDDDVYLVSRAERSEPEHADDRHRQQLHDNELDLQTCDDGIAEDKEDEVIIEEVIDENIVEAMKEEEEDEVAFLGWFPGSEA